MTVSIKPCNHIQPTVSIYCLVFNHEPFLRRCLDGFVMQQTNFPIEIVIHDDASTDNSQEIIKQYIDKYPQLQWNAILQTSNQYSQGISVPHIVLPHIRGKYMAFCEGDDYWTDPLKLQKQVDYMEANPDVSICHHSARVVWEGGEQPDSIYPPQAGEKGYREELFVNDFLYGYSWLVSSSVLYRWRFNRDDFKFEEQFPTNILSGDIVLSLFHAAVGRVVQIPGVMSAYRKHSGGVTYRRDVKDESFYTNNADKFINLYIVAEKITGKDCTVLRQQAILDCIFACMTTGNGEVLSQLKEKYPEDYHIVTRPYVNHVRTDYQQKWLNTLNTISLKKFLLGKINKFFRKIFRK